MHRHLGDESTFILQGEVMEDNGEVKGPGDQTFRLGDSQHALSVVGDEAVIFAVVLHSGFEFTL